MIILTIILFLIGCGAFALGLIKPKLVWMPTRKHSSVVYGGSAITFMIISLVIAGTPNDKRQITQQKSTEKKNSESQVNQTKKQETNQSDGNSNNLPSQGETKQTTESKLNQSNDQAKENNNSSQSENKTSELDSSQKEENETQKTSTNIVEKTREEILTEFQKIQLGQTKEKVTSILGNNYTEKNRILEDDGDNIIERVYNIGFESPREIETEFRNGKLVMKSLTLIPYSEFNMSTKEVQNLKQTMSNLEKGMTQDQATNIIDKKFDAIVVKQYQNEQDDTTSYVSTRFDWIDESRIYSVYFENGNLEKIIEK